MPTVWEEAEEVEDKRAQPAVSGEKQSYNAFSIHRLSEQTIY